MTSSTGSSPVRAALSRRAFLKGSLLTAGSLTLAGCGGTIGAGFTGAPLAAGTVEYWDLFGGGDGVRMQQMLEKFRKDHPDLSLSNTTFAWGDPYYTKLSLATLGSKPPDVAVAHLSRVPNLVGAGLVQALSEQDLSAHDMSADKFAQAAWEKCQIGGKTYAIPLDTHPFVLFYNTDICKKAGLLDADGQLKSMDGPDAFVDAMAAGKKAGADWGGVLSVDNDTASNWRVFQSLYSQLGGEVLADDGTKVIIDDAKATQVLDYLKQLPAKALMPGNVDYPGAIALFASGKSAFFMQGEWEITTFQTAKLPFSMTLFPNVFGGSKYSVQADSHTLLVPALDNDPERTDRALVLVKSLLDQSLTWAEGGHVPAWLPVQESADYKKLKPQSNYAAAAEAAAYDPPGWYSGSGSTFELVAGSAIATVRSGRGQPDSALAQMESNLQQLADTPSPI